jgi:sarcosine oxidase subunit beta
MAALHVTVIGAGTLSLASALHLAEHGVSVSVIEADRIAGGSTGRSIGVVGTQHVTALDVNLRAYGVRRIREWTRHGLDFHAIGYLRLGRSASDLALFRQSLGFQREAGISSARLLEPAEIRRLVPDISIEGIEGGLFGPEDGFLDPHRFATLLAERLRELGGSVRQGCSLLGAERRGSGYRLRTSAGATDCDGVVIAAGPWAERVARLFGHRLPVRPERHEAVTIRPGRPLPYVMPMVMDFVPGSGGTGLNFRHDRPGELVAEIHSASGTTADPDRYDEQIADASKEHLAQLLLERLPGLAGAGFGRGWAGLYPGSGDGRPYVGPFDGEPRLIAAAGAAGYGIQLAPAIGALVADWMMEGDAITVPAAAEFRPSAARLRSSA